MICVIFDMDGLMFDTEVYYRIAMNQAFEDYGLNADQKLFDRTLGMNILDTSKVLRQIPGYAKVEQDVLDRIDALMYELYDTRGVPLKPGLLELLDYLEMNNYTVGLATSTDRALAKFALEKSGVLPYFQKLVFGDMVENGKPAPDIYLLAADVLGVQPDACFVLEDSCAGIRSAASAGMRAIMIPDTIQPDDDVRALTDAVCEKLSDVIDVLQKSAN